MDGIDEGWVVFMDDMVEGVVWFVGLIGMFSIVFEMGSIVNIVMIESVGDFFFENFLFVEFLKEWFVLEVLDIFGVVEGGGGGG